MLVRHSIQNLTMTVGVIEKKWRRHDNLAVTVNDAAPCSTDLEREESESVLSPFVMWRDEYKGTFINDGTQIQPKTDPLSPSSCKMAKYLPHSPLLAWHHFWMHLKWAQIVVHDYNSSGVFFLILKFIPISVLIIPLFYRCSVDQI